MAFWNWFSSRRSFQSLPDKIWLDGEAALAGFLAAVHQQRDSGAIVLVVAHFVDQLEQLLAALEARGEPYRLIDERLTAGALPREASRAGTRLLMAPAEMLVGEPFEASQRDASLHVAILVRERHPLRAQDERVEQFAAGVPCETSVEFHVALDDALMHAFAGEWVRGVLQRLGMERNESINSQMVARRIQAAQKKLSQRAEGLALQPARSSAEWLEKNGLSGAS
jgi:preprotein translocase subunit SecA